MANVKIPYHKIITTLMLSALYTAGIGLFFYVKLLGTEEIILIKQSSRFVIVPLSMAIGFCISLVIGIAELLVFEKWTKYSFLKFVLYKYGLIITTIILGEISLFIIFENKNEPIENVLNDLPNFIKSDTFIAVFIYLLVFSIALNIWAAATEYLEPAAILDSLVGRYKQPKEETLTFIFIDLKSSTRLAEKLGHKTYSQLVDECFALLTDFLYQHKANLYQFVGDEAVLFWQSDYASKTAAPINLYFDFCRAIEHKKQHFLATFGEVPHFRAAIHEGTVTVTVIKSMKKCIVYHGDVLNTCARIMSLCSQYNVDILVSENIKKWSNTHKKYEIALADKVVLRGKEQETELYTVRRNS
ncbi:adenylate/guanylate cyclase domain-containing protein [Arcicella sp. DC2W]|uniref:Adenylate/guanylate cyclase domain-containing protein n=1 Tax=Arcicella gelida TaxID=2984195 RepID=A0ABU5S2R8_9BACT|nr:adenylate/guanylate cyclase domain-containing protein [Arcicella sp. DC2W]MEA5402741.1 adenylate/guanylate cyclase domain-containing protein [Arcicella sp. DC2W]